MSEIRAPEAPGAEILTPIGIAERPVPAWLVGESVGSWVARLELDPRQPVVVAVNGEPLLREEWSRPATAGDRVAAVLLPTGGGGNSGKILRTLAMLAIAVAAAWAGPAIAGALGFAAGTLGASIVGTIATTAITLIGGLIVNALFPVQQPKAETQEQVSPTYSLQPTGNMARIGQPIPRGYGYHRLVPDYAAQPFQEYAGDEQYLSQLFCLGLGHYDLLQIQLDDTILWRQETVRSLALSAGTVPPGSGLATDGYIATGGGSISHTTVSGRDAAVATNAPIRTRIAAAAVAGETISARCFIEARTGSATTKLAIAFLNSGLSEIDRDEVTLGATIVGQSLQLRDVKVPAGAAWIDLEVGPSAGSSTATLSGIALFEGGLDSSFDDVEIQLVPPGGELTLFPANVETNSEAGGQELLGTNQDGHDWVGPFAANQPGTLTNKLAIDVSLPMGLFDQDETGNMENATVSWEVQARLIDDEGDPISSFLTIGAHSLTRRSRRPLRQTYSYPVPAGRFEVRVKRTNAAGDITVADSLVWDGLKAYLPDDGSWPDVTLLAVRIKATNQISTTAARRLATVQQALIPVWNGTSWSAPQATRSIAWAFADAARNATYGAGLPDSRLDLAGLLALDSFYAARGDSFDFVFDTRRTIWDVLKAIGRAGRAQPVQIGHVLTLRRDQAQSLAKAVFTPGNIVRGSFKLQYVLQDDETPDDVEIHYLDEETWQPETVRCALPDSASEAPQSVDLEGVQNRDQAFREGITLAAINARRRTFVSFETELQGRLLARGDLVLVSHDLPQWGWWGRATSWSAGTLTLRLDQPVGWEAGPTHYMSLRRADGREWGPVIVTPGVDDFEIVIDEADHDLVAAAQGKTADQVILQDPDWEETHAIVGPGEQYLKRCLLLEMRPRGERTQILVVNEDEAVHTAETGVFPEPRVASLLPTRQAGPPLDGLSVVVAPDSPPEAPVLEAAWRPSIDAEYYIAQRSSDALTWTTVYEGSAPSAVVPVPPGTAYLRVAAFGTIRGPWAVWQAETPVGEAPGPLELSIFGHTSDYNIKTAALAAGWNGTDVIDVHLTIFNGIRVGSTSVSTPGLRTGSSWPVGCTIAIDNYGTVYGRGGAGGAGGSTGAGSAGGSGGDAFWNEGVPVTFNNYGTLAGGGGGGGGGGKGVSGGDQAGGGGGGGRGQNGGSAGAAGASGASAGTAGSYSAPGNGGTGKSVNIPEEGPVQFGGSGGKGGQLGSSGLAGAAGTGSGAAAGGAGGASGKAVKGDSNNTWGATGSRLGGVQSAAP